MLSVLEGAAAPPAFIPERREIWVPADQLQEVLKKHPNAVLLSREQYEALLRDGTRSIEPVKKAPRAAVLTTARYRGEVFENALSVKGELEVEVLDESAEWSPVPLIFEGGTLGALSVDGEAAVMATPAAEGAPPASTLLVRGRGTHKVAVEFTCALTLSGGERRLQLTLPPAAASSLEIGLPAGVEVQSPLPFELVRENARSRVRVAPAARSPMVDLTWRPSVAAAAPGLASELTLSSVVDYEFDAQKLRIVAQLAVDAGFGSVPARLTLPLSAGITPVMVQGEGIARWGVAEGKLFVEWSVPRSPTNQPDDAVHLTLILEMPILADSDSATFDLPVPRIDGARFSRGKVRFIRRGAGIELREILPGFRAEPMSSAEPGVVARYEFFRLEPAAPRVTVRRGTPRFDADVDTLVEFKAAAIFIERTVTLREVQGALFNVSFKLPKAEELLTIRDADSGAAQEWRIEPDGAARVRWTGASAKPRAFKISSRIEPADWARLGVEGITLAMGDLEIAGAAKLTGYIALKAESAFRLEAQPGETLEARDGRATPVRGDYAWFRRQTFGLNVKVARRPAEVLAELTGYALPQDGLLDVHARIGYSFLHSGVRSVRIRVPEKVAANFHFEGPQIAERNLSGDTWTVVFQKELSGDYALSVDAQLPGEKSGPETFHVEVPRIEPLDVARSGGVWAVEANTETEIRFASRGMNALDSLRAPVMEGYRPRQRVIGVFSFLGTDYSLGLDGVRHGAAPILTSVVDELTLSTVVSTSGTERTEALLTVRSTGAQFLDVNLPARSRLWSLSVDGELIKPVGDTPEALRVRLPARKAAASDAAPSIRVRLFYETPQAPMKNREKYQLRAPRLAADVPVLKSSWSLYLPEGFVYSGLKSNLRVPTPEPEPRWWGVQLVHSLDSLTEVRIRGGRAAKTPGALPSSDDVVVAMDIPGLDAPGAAAQPTSATKFSMAASPAEAPKNETSQTGSFFAEALKPAAAGRPQWGRLERIILPELDLKDMPFGQALEMVRKLARENDPEHRGVRIVDKSGGQIPGLSSDEGSAKITIHLTKVPVSVALNYVTQLGNVKCRIESDGTVTIVAFGMPSDVLTTREYRVRPGFIGTGAAGLHEGRVDARPFLEAEGIPFVPGMEAIYLIASSRLIVRGTQETFDLMEILVQASVGDGPSQSEGVAGLLPLDLELQKEGQLVELSGAFEAQSAAFAYEDVWARARRLWFWLIGGGVLFLALGARGGRPWWSTLWAVLILTFLPVGATFVPLCNAVLGGWVLALVLHRIGARVVFLKAIKVEVAA